MSFSSPTKSVRGGLKALGMVDGGSAEITIGDEMAMRKAEEAAARRFQATEWLRRMDHGARDALPSDPSEEDFCLALRNGLILCNLLNKVSPGAVSKVVENPVVDVQLTEGPAQSAIQYFENMRNFLVAVGEMQLLTFGASDLEKGGSSNKVVDCILCLKSYHEWNLAGGIGVWKYGGIVRISPSVKEHSPSSCEESNNRDFILLENGMSPFREQILETLNLATMTTLDETKAAEILRLLFDKFGVQLLRTLTELDAVDGLPLNGMVFIDFVLEEAVKHLFGFLRLNCNKLGLVLKEMLNGEVISKKFFSKALSKFMSERSLEVSTACPKCKARNINEAAHGETRFNNNIDASKVGHIELQLKKVQELKSDFHKTKLEIQNNHFAWGKDLKNLSHHIQGLEVAASSYRKLLEENRQLYNQIQDLKGSIRVYCRVRPFLTGQSDESSTVDYIGENGNIMIVNPQKHGKDARRIFSFNKVFGTSSSQDQVFSDTQPLIRSVLDGYNVCIFAYGQTGSGKTYTMSGPDLNTEETWGVNYRALSDLFHLSNGRKHLILYDISVQMIEIYNEQDSKRSDWLRSHFQFDGNDIRNSSQQNGLNVPDASLVSVSSTQDVLELMNIGQKNRAVGATALNIRSSRSHSVLTVHVQGKELASESILRGCLHLVDLAGSERVDKSEAVGERLKEAQHINKSLSALGDVISALAQKNAHIPYRNSKLTQVLQDSLGGHAKTLMFVHINPEVNAFGETVSTLKFAERVASIDLGAARSNKEAGEIRVLKDEISNLKSALERKEAELTQLKAAGVSHVGPEMMKSRPISPLLVHGGVNGAVFKPEINHTVNDEPSKRGVVRSSSSGKQRRPHFPAMTRDKEHDVKNLIVSDGRLVSRRKQRSPSPPARRSISTDRAAFIRNNKLKVDTFEDNHLTMKSKFPLKPAVNRSLAPILTTDLIDDNPNGRVDAPVLPKQENISEVLSHLLHVHQRNIYTEPEEEQFKSSLNARPGGIRKNKTDNSSKVRFQQPSRSRTATNDAQGQMRVELESKVDAAQKVDLTETENGIVDSHFVSNLRAKKIRQFPRTSNNIEQRGFIQVADSAILGKLENKIASGFSRLVVKDGSNTSMPEIKRSRSSPRGRLNIFS